MQKKRINDLRYNDDSEQEEMIETPPIRYYGNKNPQIQISQDIDSVEKHSPLNMDYSDNTEGF